MFNNQSSNFLFKETGRSQARSEPAYSKKNEQFHKQIRRQQIQEKMRIMREKLLASMSEDYYLLKGINLNETLRSFQQLNESQIESCWESLDKLAIDMFVYSKSDQSSHINQLIDDQIITKMTNLLQIRNIQSFERNPRTYIRILWIVQNYTNYVADSDSFKSEIPSSMIDCKQIAQTIFAELVSIPFLYSQQGRYKIFSHSQTKQVLGIVLSTINNLSKNNDILLGLCFAPFQGLGQSVLAFLIKECYKIIDFTHKDTIIDTIVPNIISNMLAIFEKVLRLEIDQKPMEKVYELDLRVVDVILELLSLIYKQDKERAVQQQACFVLKSFLETHILSKPQIIITHNFTLLFDMYKNITSSLININYDIFNYHNMLDVQGVSKPPLSVFKIKATQLEKRCILLLQIFYVMFSINIPQDNFERYDQIYGCWVDDYLLPIFQKIFKINDPNFDKIRHEILLILGNMCLQEYYCDLILGELPILNKIFYYIHSKEVNHNMKKAALNVLNSIIKIAIQQESDLRMEVIDLLKNNRIVEILVEHIGEFSEKKVNKDLLHSLLLFLRTEVSEDRSDHLIWAEFCTLGGQAQLQKLHSSTKDAELQEAIELILDEYRCS